MERRMMIAVLPDGCMRQTCRELNFRLRRVGLSPELLLGDANAHPPSGSPHVSMLHFMRTDENRVELARYLPDLLDDLATVFRGIGGIGGEVGKPALFRSGYVCVEARAHGSTLDLHWRILERMRPFIKQRIPSSFVMDDVEKQAWEEYGFANCAGAWQPHFTVGRLEQRDLPWREPLEGAALPMSWQAIELVCGLVGEHGILQTVELRQPLV